MTEELYKKIDIAVEYLDLAASLWLTNEKLFCSAHLAGAAEEISGQYCRLGSLDSKRDRWERITERITNG